MNATIAGYCNPHTTYRLFCYTMEDDLRLSRRRGDYGSNSISVYNRKLWDCLPLQTKSAT